MSTKVPQDNTDQEIDLADVSKKINGFFESTKRSIFNAIQFFIKNWKISAILIIVGFGIGLFLDKTQKKYDHQIIVAPNFGSIEYLYSKIDLISSKINEDDSLFLKKNVGIKKPNKLVTIEIEPVADVYNFINNKPENFELIKLMADNGDIKKIISDDITSKNYRFHSISIRTDGLIDDKEIIEPILKYLNEAEYYKKIQEAQLANVKAKMAQNEVTIAQIDGVLNEFSANANSQKSDKLVYYNENNQLNDVIRTKGDLVNEQGSHRLELIGYDKIIKDISTTINIEKKGILYGHKKLLFPFLFILIYISLQYFKNFYRKQKSLIVEKTV
ncbi:hypothetical protein GCM10022422_00150 [Flavobacterium ginsengisoli]|uniref:Polysaccharide chain length determinant N-terminal domain-containing protein n=1 Tax=Flavobacterium ginsengisoli TaxID=871694 RepID=A0ABP7ETS8_9FLAO|nr:hypothetical protein [Flavobacterium ginsengisoli]